MRARPLIGWVVPALLLVAGCGGSGGSGNSNEYSGSAAPATTAPAATAAAVVKTGSASVDGKTTTVLTDSRGFTLYYFTPDKGGKITCTAQCAASWPPLVVASGTTVPHSADLTGAFTTVSNPEGKGMQVLYNNWPLYTWVKDQKPGDATGQNVGGKWFAATPDLSAAAPSY